MSEEKRMNDNEAEEYCKVEAKDWFKWMLITFLGFTVLALIFVIAPNYR